MAQTGVERNQEIKDARIYHDVRGFGQKLSDSLSKPDNFRNLMLAIAVSMIVLPSAIPTLFLSSLMLRWWFLWQEKNFRMPVRYPEHIGLIDPTERDDNAGVRKGRGIEYMGAERKGRTIQDTLEIWASDSDVRTHRVIMGTTGAGKTQSLLSILFNPLCWGSGFSMTDGKAQIDVTANIFVMSWLFWREDDILILNYMRGGQDRFKELVNKIPVGKRKSRVSNTWNPFATANHETVNQIIDSIMEKAGGDGAQWQAKAINMKNALVQTIAYFRASGTMLMSVSAIREQMALDNMIKLALRNDLPPMAAAAIRSYLSSGLPGFQWNKAKSGKPQDQEAYIQHGYLAGQFTRTLGLMSDTYADIFGDDIPEFDTSDIILNNRISMTMIPTLEKGVEEAGNLGKMQVASAKMMMAENLGYELEGIYEDVVENRPTNTHRPFYMVMDELGYYFAPGIDLMFAQGRSLNIALIAAGQDFQAMAKNNKSEVESMIANTRFKIAMKLEDPKETFEIFQKAAGQGAVARLHGFDLEDPGEFGLGSGLNYKFATSANIEHTDRISLQELKKLGPGDGVMVVGEKVIRFRGFNLFMKLKFDKKKVSIRINTFLPIAGPDNFGVIAPLCRTADSGVGAAGKRLALMLRSPITPDWGKIILDEPSASLSRRAKLIDTALCSASLKLDEKPNVPATHRGIVLLMAGICAMKELEEGGLANKSGADDDDRDSGAGGSVSVRPVTLGTDSIEPSFDDDFGTVSTVHQKQNSDWLNNPPIRLELHDGEDSEKAGRGGMGLDGEDMEFGAQESANEPALTVALTESTKKAVATIIENVSGGKEAVAPDDVKKEISVTENMVSDACSFKEVGTGSKDDPVVISNHDEAMDLLNSIGDMLSR